MSVLNFDQCAVTEDLSVLSYNVCYNIYIVIGGMMAKSDALTLRIDRELKNKGNLMLKEMGITPSALVNMAYSQLINQRRIPFEIRAKSVTPDLGMTDDEIDTMIDRGHQDIKNKNYADAEKIFRRFDEKYGISSD